MLGPMLFLRFGHTHAPGGRLRVVAERAVLALEGGSYIDPTEWEPCGERPESSFATCGPRPWEARRKVALV